MEDTLVLEQDILEQEELCKKIWEGLHHQEKMTYKKWESYVDKLDINKWEKTDKNIPKPPDSKWAHPLLHEISHQAGRDDGRKNNVRYNKCFIKLWECEAYYDYHDTEIYRDKYRLTAKQRLSTSYPADNKIIYEFISDRLNVKYCKKQENMFGGYNLEKSDYLIDPDLIMDDILIKFSGKIN